MKFTLSWLKEHLDTEAPLAALVDRLTMIGLEVESVADKAAALAPFTIARVISAEQHPNADRLRVCMVDTGAGEPVQVVCGAPNARTGMMSVFSPPGTFIPGKNMTLGIGTIRGVESRGMLCSPFELQISDDHDGILDLPADAPLGARYAQWAHLDDPVIEINLTPNRPDCTGVHGIARDLAAADMGTLRRTPIKPIAGIGSVPGRGAARFRDHAVAVPRLCACAWCAASRTARARNGCSGGSPRSGCGPSMRWSTSPISSPMTAAGRCMCSMPPRSKGNLVVRRARRGRDPAGARRQDLCARRHHVRHRRRQRRRIARRHHGRGGQRLLGDDHRRADRVGAVGRDQHRPYRPQAEHQFRRALPLRARRRSRLHGSGPGARDPHGARPLRRDPDGNHRGRAQCPFRSG